MTQVINERAWLTDDGHVGPRKSTKCSHWELFECQLEKVYVVQNVKSSSVICTPHRVPKTVDADRHPMLRILIFQLFCFSSDFTSVFMCLRKVKGAQFPQLYAL